MISSCGRPGLEVKAICGLLALPETLMLTVTSLMSALATMSSRGLGGRCPVNWIWPRVTSKRWPEKL
jgi:hypothetical protein